ncbi:MAG: hypothetical protein IT210_00595 [Armatimonadetes bacterium]|nr:hypothetical protein [Armatimonadota bacterium]
MYRHLADATLKTGETMQMGVIQGPEERFQGQIEPFLGHKGGLYHRHIELSMRQPLDRLETRFYIGAVGGNIITNIMTVESEGVGILGHVYTLPDQRRKGACQAVMAQQMEDFRRRGGGMLALGTGFDSPPYWIYHSFGFRGIEEGSGTMRYVSSENFLGGFFARSPVTIAQVSWHHWATMTALSMLEGGDYVRSVAYNIHGMTNFEGGFLYFKEAVEGQNSHQALLLENARGAVVGWGMFTPDSRWRSQVYLFDLFLHFDFIEGGKMLWEQLDTPEAKIQCYVDRKSEARIALLESIGFHHEATFQRQLSRQGKLYDVLVYTLR